MSTGDNQQSRTDVPPTRPAGHGFARHSAAQPVRLIESRLNGNEDMTDEDYRRKLGEVDQVLNDPDLPMQPALIWQLLAEISKHESQASMMAQQQPG